MPASYFRKLHISGGPGCYRWRIHLKLWIQWTQNFWRETLISLFFVMCFQYLQPTPVIDVANWFFKCLFTLSNWWSTQAPGSWKLFEGKLSSHPFCLQDELRQCFPGVMIENPICRLCYYIFVQRLHRGELGIWFTFLE